MLWRGSLPALAYPGWHSIWAESAGNFPFYKLERACGVYPDGVLHEWYFRQHSLGELSGLVVPQYLYVWTDGSLVTDGLADTGYALCGVFADLLPEMMRSESRGVLFTLLFLSLCRLFKRAEMWGAFWRCSVPVLFY